MYQNTLTFKFNIVINIRLSKSKSSKDYVPKKPVHCKKLTRTAGYVESKVFQSRPNTFMCQVCGLIMNEFGLIYRVGLK